MKRISKKILLISFVLFFVAGNFSLPGFDFSNDTLACPPEKVVVCHRTGSLTNPWVEIEIALSALEAHLAQHEGDFVVEQGALCPPPPVCGNGVLETGEECDDGNTEDNDGCSANCVIEEEECIPEGGSEAVIPDAPECCEGLIQIGCEQPNQSGECLDECTGAFYCTNCGDGICGLGENKCNCPEDCEEEELTIYGYKVVCDSEEYLPNWGDGQDIQMITEEVVNDFIAQNSEYCHLEEDWNFQWGRNGEAQKQNGDHIGPAPDGTGWNNFDTSTGVNPAEVVLTADDLNGTNQIWIRENLKQGYVPFSNPPGDLQYSTSAEMYCYNDILNYDNYDYIINPELGESYYCVAFNALATSTEPYCELELTKTDDVDPVEPGDEILYHLALENIGTADCTGTGVRIKDVFDQNTTYVSSNRTPEETTGTYIKWNVGTLHPGDKVEIDLTMLVSEETECGTTLENKVKYWSNQTDWSDFVIEETTIECPPTCGDGIVNGNEECDDGNNEDGDGCSASCTIEPSICENIIAVSNTDDNVFDATGTFIGKAISTYNLHPAWTAIINDATWIWKSYYVENPTQDETYIFSKDFNIVGTVASATLEIAADNTYKVWINNVFVGEDLTEYNYNHVSEYNVTDKLQSGANTIKFEVMNMELAGSNAESNPAGLLYKLDIARSSCEQSSSTLFVIKDVVGGTATAGDFTIYVSGNNPSLTSFPGEESPGTTVMLSPGIYSVSESTSSDYITLLSADCANTIGTGETKTCTITNTYQFKCTPTTPCSVLGCGKTDSCGKYCGNCPGGCTTRIPCSVLGCGKTDSCGKYCGSCGESPFCGDGIVNGDEECDGEAGVTEGYFCTDSCVLEILEKEICTMDLNVMMVMDVSGSMGNGDPTKLSQAQIAANSFIDNLRESDQSGLVSFSWVATLNKNLSNDHASTQSVINGLVADGATNIGEAVDKANQELMSIDSSSEIARIEILLTDGKANQPNGDGFEEDPADLALALNKSLEAAENGITMFTIGLGDDVNTTMLQNMAENTGAIYYFAPTSDDLSGIFDQIASETCKDSSATTSIYASLPVAIFDARIVAVSDTNVTVSWLTNVPATSRVVYDTVPHSTPGDAPDYGYAWSTPEDDTKTTLHTVTIAGLIPGTPYYWRAISRSSPEKLGDELTFSTESTTSPSAPSEPTGESESETIPEPEISATLPDEEDEISLGEDEEDEISLGEIEEKLEEEGMPVGLIASIFNSLKGAIGDNFYLCLLLIFIILFLLWLLSKRKKKKEK